VFPVQSADDGRFNLPALTRAVVVDVSKLLTQHQAHDRAADVSEPSQAIVMPATKCGAVILNSMSLGDAGVVSLRRADWLQVSPGVARRRMTSL